MLQRLLTSLLPKLLGLLAASWLVFCGTSAAAEISVTASLSDESVAVGEATQFQIKVTGADGAGQPPEVKAPGLEVRYLGPSQSTNMRVERGRITSELSVTYIYNVEGARSGTFTIQPATVVVNGGSYETEPVALKVGPAPAGGAAGNNSGGAATNSAAPRQQAGLEVLIPKKTLYVGEMSSVDIRLWVDAQIRWQPETMPEISGEGFVKQKMPEPQRQQGTRDGREVDILVFHTAITPGKAGSLTLGPVEIPYVAQVPRARRSRPRSAFDAFPDIFGDQMFAENQRFRARAEPVELIVKALPAAGKPQDFSGAVGQFEFAAAGTPSHVNVGDPLTMTLTVSGQGNFDRIEAPTLTSPAGWRAYPPSAEFKQADDIGLRGTKTFHMAVIPETSKTAMPQFQFSYFDPADGRYVTLKSAPAALVVEGSAPPTPPPVVLQQTAPGATPAEKGPSPTDILGLRYDSDSQLAQFEPIYASRGFLLAQLVPATWLLLLLGLKFLRTDPAAGEKQMWRREKSAVLNSLRSSKLSDEQFLDAAVRAVQLETALSTGRRPESVDASAARASRQLDTETEDGLDEVFSARAQVLYAGAGPGQAELGSEGRRRIVATIDRFQRSHGHV